MNELIISNNPITSMQIAEITGKRHADIMRDIRDEIEKLNAGGISNERKFALVDYIDSKGEKRPCYQLSKEGVLQLAARYDAVVRARLIELAMRQDKPQSIEDLIIMQAQSMKELRGQVSQLTGTIGNIKEAVISEPDNWREDINRKLNKIAKALGNNKFKEIRSESYKLLEQRAGVNLEVRLDNKRLRMLKEGMSRTAINQANKIDIIDSDKKLREIYGKIVSEYLIKYVA
jgi:Rha family phage regulatory protein